MAQITLFGTAHALSGEPPVAGERARDFLVHRFTPDEGIVPVTLADLPRKPRLLSVVPSLDTPVCAEQTRSFATSLAALRDGVAAYTISLDLPFAQGRFCGAEGIEGMQTLSDYQERSFGLSWGLLIEDMKLLARSVFVLDADDTIVHAEVVPELTQHPNYGAALHALRGLADRA